jgi:hypothetical protein
MDNTPELLAGGEEPRGDCFVAAFNHFLALTDANPLSNAVLVHGNLDQLPQDHDVNHAWVEENDIVHEVSNGQNLRFPQRVYYERYRVSKVRRYTLQEALMNNLREGHYGAWLK